MEILIAGDLVPTQSNINLFNKADVNSLLGEDLLAIWKSADIRIFNLEVPLTDKENPIDKCGPNLIAPTSTIEGIKALDPTIITLANNHILDQGKEGLKSTKEILDKYEIPFMGIGDNLYKANKPYIIYRDKLKIGAYACAEYEFSIATESKPGANPFDPLQTLDDIRNLKAKCDYVIVLYHGGKEHYRYPSPYLKKVCRKIAEKGADIIICQHSHCIGCYEKYDNSTIIYGQGNFLFDYSDSDYWKTSLLLNVKIDKELSIEFIPFVKENNGIRLATGHTKEDILNAFEQRSQKILREGFIKEQYQKISLDNIESYLRNLSGCGKWVSRVDRYLFKGKLIKKRYNKQQLLAIQNYIECEAHRELLIEGLKGNK